MAKCPRPDKQAHATRADAERHLKHHQRDRGMGLDLVSYQCGCGSWHIGNSRESFTKRIQASLRKGPRRKPKTRRA